jgi:micrococcal nuclease
MYHYQVNVLRVVDGDTVDVSIDLGFDIWHKARLRLAGIDAPETRTRDLEEKARGFKAKETLTHWLNEAQDEGENITIRSDEYEPQRGKFGRVLATIFVGETNVNAQLLALGLVEVYK